MGLHRSREWGQEMCWRPRRCGEGKADRGDADERGKECRLTTAELTFWQAVYLHMVALGADNYACALAADQAVHELRKRMDGSGD